MIVSQLSEVKWKISLTSSNQVCQNILFDTSVLLVVLHFINEDAAPDFKYKINLHDLLKNDVCGALLMKKDNKTIGALKGLCLESVKNIQTSAFYELWGKVLEQVKKTNSIQIFASGSIQQFVNSKRVITTVIIARRKSDQFIAEKHNESIRKSS